MLQAINDCHGDVMQRAHRVYHLSRAKGLLASKHRWTSCHVVQDGDVCIYADDLPSASNAALGIKFAKRLRDVHGRFTHNTQRKLRCLTGTERMSDGGALGRSAYIDMI